MLIGPHFLTGAAIASQTPELLPAALAAVTLHFVLDAIPHKDYIGEPQLTRPNVLLIVGDLVVALVLFVIFIKPEVWKYALVIGAFAILPDIIELPKYFWPKWSQLPGVKQFSYWHGEMVQHCRRVSFLAETWPNWFWGLLPQVIVILAAIYFILT